MPKNVSFEHFLDFLRKMKNSKVHLKIRSVNFTQKTLKF